MAVMVVVPSELLGPEQGVGEIDEQAHGHESRERIVESHCRSPIGRVVSARVPEKWLPVFRQGHAPTKNLESVAGIDVANRQREEDNADSDHDDVHHGNVSEPESGSMPAKA
jgi:hypothetical protein